MKPILTLFEHHQSLWLADTARDMLLDGGLERLVAGGLRGLVSYPPLFEQAVMAGSSYDDAIRDLIQADPEIDGETLYQWLAIQDLQMSADQLRPIYETSRGADGYVAFDLDPRLAQDTQAMLERARHLWRMVDRPNLMVNVPATEAGLIAVEELLVAGIAVNATLVFSLEQCQRAAEACVRGATRAPGSFRPTSLVSFPFDKLDAKVDEVLKNKATKQAHGLKGRLGVATARLAHLEYRQDFHSSTIRQARETGVALPRLAWWATPPGADYRSLHYAEALIGAGTVVIMTPQTLDQFLEWGEIRDTLSDPLALEAAKRDRQALAAAGIELSALAEDLQAQAVDSRVSWYNRFIDRLLDKRAQVARDFAGTS